VFRADTILARRLAASAELGGAVGRTTASSWIEHESDHASLTTTLVEEGKL
jgi:hypothetical protein